MKHLYIALVLVLVVLAHSMAFNDIPPEDFTDTGVGCIYCLDPAPEPPECADNCEAARLGDNLHLTIKEGE